MWVADGRQQGGRERRAAERGELRVRCCRLTNKDGEGVVERRLGGGRGLEAMEWDGWRTGGGVKLKNKA